VTHAGKGFFAVARVIDVQARVRERLRNRRGERPLILDKQNP